VKKILSKKYKKNKSTVKFLLYANENCQCCTINMSGCTSNK